MCHDLLILSHFAFINSFVKDIQYYASERKTKRQRTEHLKVAEWISKANGSLPINPEMGRKKNIILIVRCNMCPM